MTIEEKVNQAYGVLTGQGKPLTEVEALAAESMERYINECVMAERERCAKIAESLADHASNCPQTPYMGESLTVIKSACKSIANRIRKGE